MIEDSEYWNPDFFFRRNFKSLKAGYLGIMLRGLNSNASVVGDKLLQMKSTISPGKLSRGLSGSLL